MGQGSAPPSPAGWGRCVLGSPGGVCGFTESSETSAWVRFRARLTERRGQCPHPRPVSEARRALPRRPPASSLLPAAPSCPKGEGQAGLKDAGTGSSGMGGVPGEGSWSALCSCWEGRWGEQRLGGSERLGDVGFPSRGSARELGGGGRLLALPPRR